MLEEFKSQKFDIIIQAGQSNSEGYGSGPVTEEYVEDDDILYFISRNGYTIKRAAERLWDPSKGRSDPNNIAADYSLTFSAEYKKAGLLAPGRKILIIRSAVGGTGFCDKRWRHTDDLYRRMIDMTTKALELNPENKLIALLWHQGETDSGTSAEKHCAQLSGLVNSVRGLFKSPKLPFIAGDFCHEWKYKNIKSCEPTVNGIIDTCTDVGYARFVLTDTLLSNNEKYANCDDIHFCRESLYILGRRYFAAYRAISGR